MFSRLIHVKYFKRTERFDKKKKKRKEKRDDNLSDLLALASTKTARSLLRILHDP